MARVPEKLRARDVHLLTERDLQAHSFQQSNDRDFVDLRHVTQHWHATLAQTQAPPPRDRDAGSQTIVAQAEANEEEVLVKRVRCPERGEPNFATAFDASLNFSYKAFVLIIELFYKFTST